MINDLLPTRAQQMADAIPAWENFPREHSLESSDQACRYLLEGKVLTWVGRRTEIRSPICLQREGRRIHPIIGHAPQMDESAAMAGLQASVKAWDHGNGDWPTRSSTARIEAVEKFAYLMKNKRNEVVRLLMWEIGKSLADSRHEFDRTLEYILRTIAALKDLDRSSGHLLDESGVLAKVRRAPLGVVLSMGPFNYPLNETYTTLLPALIMGNTVVVKPPKYGLLIHQPLLPAFAESFPPGVVNFIYGSGAEILPPLMQTGLIDVLAFIGSSQAAASLTKQHPHPHRLRSVLGLDAKNPGLVMADADLEVSVRECVTGSLSYNGQRCTALKILFVHESIVTEFLQKLSAAVEALVIGQPWDNNVNITPLAEADKIQSMQKLVDDAVSKGARVINPSGGVTCENLFFPAILYPVTSTMALFQVEQFGPLVPVCSYQDEAEFIGYVTASHFGQQVSLFGQNPEKLTRLIKQLENQVCRINLNTQCQRGPDTLPFAGRKDSAEGTLSISDALDSFSINSVVATPSRTENRKLIETC